MVIKFNKNEINNMAFLECKRNKQLEFQLSKSHRARALRFQVYFRLFFELNQIRRAK